VRSPDPAPLDPAPRGAAPAEPCDVVVVGAGPAGRALAAACATSGLRTTLLDPAPERAWRITYGAWSAELPPELPASAIAVRARGRAVALSQRELGWEYSILDVPGLRAHLDAGLADVSVRVGRAAGVGPDGVLLVDGSLLPARVVADAGGYRQPLRAAPERVRPSAEQTAYGVIVDEGTAAPVVAPGEAMFMDWRPADDSGGWPTFLYAVPLGGSRVLLEETSLARRPGLALDELRERLLVRLARHGVIPDPHAEVERVHFPVDSPRHSRRTSDAIGFGAAAPLMHPATGFSVATALRLAPQVAEAIAAHLPGDARGALAAARAVLWPPAARAVHTLRRRGLEALLRMPPDEVPAFFEVFFALPERHRWAYLTGRDDLAGTVAAMNALFGQAGWGLRGRLVGPALRPPLRTNGSATAG
jgi:lycopene beta-cyclase